jgi:hypothetical protein
MIGKIIKGKSFKGCISYVLGKEKAKTHCLKEPDKTKYDIYKAIQAALKSAKNWKQLENQMRKENILLKFKHKLNFSATATV